MFQKREYTIDQRLLSVRNMYVVRDRHGEPLGFVKQEFVSLGPKFWFEDKNGVHLGEIDGKIMTVRNEYEIKNKNGQLKAKIKKKILKFFGSEWWMEDQDGHKIARIKGNLVRHTYNIISPKKNIIAKIHLKWAAIRDEYCIEIIEHDFDPFLILSFAIAMDHVEHKQRSPILSGTKIIGRLFGR
jgi:uncharacterized protein YxjI